MNLRLDFFPAGFGKPPHHLPSLTHASKGLNPRQYLKHLLLSTAGVDGTTRTTTSTVTVGIRDRQWRTDSGTAGPDRRAQMLQMITALEELQRTFNSTLSSRITIIPRGNHGSHLVFWSYRSSWLRVSCMVKSWKMSSAKISHTVWMQRCEKLQEDAEWI